MKSKTKPPQHIAIIMDGNRRWARQHKLEIFKGHEKVAAEVMEKLVDRAIELGISYLTFWAFSTENWQRNQKEVAYLTELLFRKALNTSSSKLHKKGVRIKTIGDLSAFKPDVQKKLQYWVDETKDNRNITVVFALNYGGRDEIVRAASQLVQDVMDEKLVLEPIIVSTSKKPRLVTTEIFSRYLDSYDLPEPGLIIRTGGEQRMSGFLPWTSEYSEFYFTEVLMPDFDEQEFDKALREFGERKRRFGK